MDGADAQTSPLERAAGAAGPETIDAFKLLSDETRLAVLLALWEAYNPHAETNTASFTDLYKRVDVEDSGNFSYHLDKLVGHFVEEDEDGYRLSNAGRKIVRAVIAGTGLEERTLEPTAIPRSCPWCGSSVEISYEDQRLYHACTQCEGNLGPHSTENAPEGTLCVHDGFHPAGLVDRTAEEVFVAGTIDYHHTVSLIIRGICPACSGPVEESLQLCEGHASQPGEVCSSCGTWNEARAAYVCSVCKHNVSYPAWVAAFDHPAIVAFYYAHGFEGTYGVDDPEAAGQLWERLIRDQEVVSRTPIRIRVTIEDDGETLELTLDGDLDVVEVSRPAFEPAETPSTSSGPQ